MNYNSLKYSLKVWLSTVVSAAAIYFIGAYLNQPVKTDLLSSFVEPYLLFAFFEMVCSIVTWLVFWFAVELMFWIVDGNGIRKFFLSLTGMALTAATFRVFSLLMSFSLSGNFLILMLINCGWIGMACWYFNLEPKKAPQSHINPWLYETETQK